MSWFFGHGGRREESQNDSESLSNDANLSTISTSETEGRINQMQAEIKTKDFNIAKQNSLIAQLRSEVESRTTENENLQNDLKSTKSTLREANISIASLYMYKKELEATKSSLRAANVAKYEKIVDLEAPKSTLQAEFEDNKAEIAEMNYRFSQMQRNMESKSAEIKKLQKELESTKSSLQESIATNASLVKNIERLTKSVESLRENQHIPDTTIRARFTGISKLSDANVYSQPTHVSGIDWRIHVRRDGDNLAVGLHGEKPNAAKWSCSVFCDMQLISQKNDKVVLHRRTLMNTFSKKNQSCGFTKFITFEDLNNEEKGFMMGNSILLCAVMRVFPSK